jgi:hypothetical protein
MQTPATGLGKLVRHRSAEDVLDEAAEMSFPASDPISIDVSYDRAKRVQKIRAKARKPRPSSAARVGRTRSSFRT